MKCQNGKTVYGVTTSNGGWSYAYCSSVGSIRATAGTYKFV
ncbi:hypothetical protein [Streptomyces sp. NPDC012888]